MDKAWFGRTGQAWQAGRVGCLHTAWDISLLPIYSWAAILLNSSHAYSMRPIRA